MQGRRRGDEGGESADVAELSGGQRERRFVAHGVDVRPAAAGVEGQVASGSVGERAFESERGNGEVDGVGAHGRERPLAERCGAIGGDHKVGGGDPVLCFGRLRDDG